MRLQEEFWKKLLAELSTGNRVVLLYVIDSSGSSPGRQGFKMLVSESGFLWGSIGGGIMEFKLVEWCKETLLKAEFAPFIKRQIHQGGIKENKSGMICSGEQTIAFYSLTQEAVPLVASILKAVTTHTYGLLQLTEVGIDFQSKHTAPQQFHLALTHDGKWNCIEDIGFQPQLLIVGGGHVGLALSTIGKQLGFAITVFDDRDDLNTIELNQSARFVKVSDYTEIDQYIPTGDHHYVVLMSFGYRTDKVILKRLIGKTFRYLGMMGSKEKVKTLFQELEQEGIARHLIDQVYSPIGVQIYSKTPEEIAISILAELIKVKNSPSASVDL
ncbi:MAG: XdhC family protein [Flammeovirgaceae bacterium]